MHTITQGPLYEAIKQQGGFSGIPGDLDIYDLGLGRFFKPSGSQYFKWDIGNDNHLRVEMLDQEAYEFAFGCQGVWDRLPENMQGLWKKMSPDHKKVVLEILPKFKEDPVVAILQMLELFQS